METSSGQYSPVYLPGEPLTMKLSRPRSTWLQSAELNQSGPARIGARIFACGSSAPVRVEHEEGAAAWLVGTWRCHMCRDTNCLHRRSYGPIRVFSQASWIRRPLWPVLSVAPPVQTLTGLSSLGFFSVVQCIRHIDGHPGWSPTL